jgi:elongation factor Ts
MMDCKKALEEAEGDFQKAVDIIREKGKLVAAKRADRETKQGVIAAKASDCGCAIALVEVNCETDFVARNSDFGAFADHVAEVALTADPAETLKDELVSKIAAIGEKIEIRRFARFEKQGEGVLASYIHMGGKSGVIVELGCTKPETAAAPEAKELARNLCLQIVASAPRYIAPEDVSAADIAAESEIYRKQLLDQGKPEKMIDQIIKGKLNKFFGEICLLKQVYVKDLDGKLTVEKLIADAGKALGDTLTVRRYQLFNLGA